MNTPESGSTVATKVSALLEQLQREEEGLVTREREIIEELSGLRRRAKPLREELALVRNAMRRLRDASGTTARKHGSGRFALDGKRKSDPEIKPAIIKAVRVDALTHAEITSEVTRALGRPVKSNSVWGHIRLAVTGGALEMVVGTDGVKRYTLAAALRSTGDAAL